MMPGPVAILCSGQGGQHRGMFDLVAGSPRAEPIFRAAADLLGDDPRSFVRQCDEAALFDNRAGQILCCTQALAAWAVVEEVLPGRTVIAGYSVGELAAWGCAGILEAGATLGLARDRAAAMDSAAPARSGLAGVVGLGADGVAAIVGRTGAHLAIVNDLDSFVIGGTGEAVDAFCRQAEAAGARRVVRLRVAVPSHTPLLKAAAAGFRQALQGVGLHRARAGARLLSGLDGGAVFDLAVGCDKLAAQICTTIDWRACLESCRSAGAQLALELGPGTALSRMAAALFAEGDCRSIEDFRTADGLRAWLGRERWA